MVGSKTLQKQAPIFKDFSGGLNVRDYAHVLEDNEATVATNVYFGRKGAVTRRAGWQLLTTTVCPTAGALIGLFHAAFLSGLTITRNVLATDGVKIFSLAGAVWTEITGALAMAVSASAIVRMVQMNNLVIGFDGENAPWQYNGAGNAAALGGAPPVATMGIVWGNRMWFARGTRLYFSEVGDPNTYLSTSFIDVPSQFDGEIITGLTILYGNLYIFKRQSVYTLTGGDLTTFVLNKTNSSVGCVSDTGLMSVGNLIYFVSDKGLYAMNLFNNRPVSYKVEPRYSNAVANQLQAGVLTKNRIMMLHYRYRGQIWCAVDATVGGQDHHDRLMVHDYIVVDAKTSDPAASEYTKTGTEAAPSVMADYYYNSAQVVPICSFYDKYVYIYSESSSADQDSNQASRQILANWVSKYFDFGDPEAIKQLRWHWIIGVFNGGAPTYTVTKSDDIGVSSTAAAYTPVAGTFFNSRGLFPASALDPVAAKFFKFGFSSSDGGSFIINSITFDIIWKGRRY